MLFDPPLLPGTLERRYKRFLADVVLDSGETVTAHCPNPGSMLGLAEGRPRVFLSDNPSPTRKLRYGLELLEREGAWVGVHTGRANDLVAEAIQDGRIPELGTPGFRREVRVGDSRLDFALDGQGGDVLVEVKNVTLADAGVAYFPDSVTKRGLKHIETLVAARSRPDVSRVVLLFWINRSDCTRVRPAEWIDPAYAAALRRAVGEGLEVLCVDARVGPEGIGFKGRLPLDLAPMDAWPDPPRWMEPRLPSGAGS